jgi:hypothetical protein
VVESPDGIERIHAILVETELVQFVEIQREVEVDRWDPHVSSARCRVGGLRVEARDTDD